MSEQELKDARELAAIMNRARRVDVARGGLSLDCRTPEDCARAVVLLTRQGRAPERHGGYRLHCAARRTADV